MRRFRQCPSARPAIRDQHEEVRLPALIPRPLRARRRVRSTQRPGLSKGCALTLANRSSTLLIAYSKSLKVQENCKSCAKATLSGTKGLNGHRA